MLPTLLAKLKQAQDVGGGKRHGAAWLAGEPKRQTQPKIMTQLDFMAQIEQRLAKLEALHAARDERGLLGDVKGALQIVRAEQSFALVKARAVIEQVVDDIYRRELPEARPKPLFDAIGALVYEGVFSQRIAADLDYIRIKANLVVHTQDEPLDVTTTDVEVILLLTMNLVEWYLTVYQGDGFDHVTDQVAYQAAWNTDTNRQRRPSSRLLACEDLDRDDEDGRPERSTRLDYLAQIERRLCELEALRGVCDDHVLLSALKRALAIARADKPLALAKARSVIEHIVDEIYRRGLPEAKPKPLFDAIGALMKQGVFIPSISSALDYIRHLGSFAAHPPAERIDASERDVEVILLLALKLVDWYVFGYLGGQQTSVDAPGRDLSV